MDLVGNMMRPYNDYHVDSDSKISENSFKQISKYITASD